MKYPNGSEPVMTDAPFSQLRAIRHCPCEDGKARFVLITGQPDTVWTVPGRINVSVKGKSYSIPGWAESNENGYTFHASVYRLKAIAAKLTGLEENALKEALIDNLLEKGHNWLVAFIVKKKVWNNE